MDHLKSMTVADLKAIANQMSVPFNSRIKKVDLVEAISSQIEKDHIRAIEDDAFLFPTMTTAEETYTITDENGVELVVLTGESAALMNSHMKRVKRYNPSLRRGGDGKVVLTPKQRRRIAKKDRQLVKSLGW